MQDSKGGGRCVVFAGPETKKPSARAGFDLELQWRRSGYPASRASGRRAREVMPAAMRAEIRMSALAHGVCIGGNPRPGRPGPQGPSRSEARRGGQEWAVRVELGGHTVIQKKKKNT